MYKLVINTAASMKFLFMLLQAGELINWEIPEAPFSTQHRKFYLCR